MYQAFLSLNVWCAQTILKLEPHLNLILFEVDSKGPKTIFGFAVIEGNFE